MSDPQSNCHVTTHGYMVSTNTLSSNLFNHVPFAIYTCDKQGYILSFNKAAIKLWGCEPEIGKVNWADLWKIYHPDGTPLPVEDSPMAVALKEGRAVEGDELLIQLPDYSLRYVQPYPAPLFDHNGEIIGSVNTVVDITDQKNDEKKQAMLAAIIESSEDAIISKTLDGNITSWNHSAQKLFGYNEQEIIGKHITILIPPELQMEESLIIKKIKNSERIEHFETTRVAKNGKRISISLTVSPILNNKGHIIGASKIVRDISKQKTAEESLQRYAESLEILNSVGQVISAELNVENIAQKVTEATTRLTGADFGAFFHNDSEQPGPKRNFYTLAGVSKNMFEQMGMLDTAKLFNTTFAGQGIVRINDITSYHRFNLPNLHNNTDGELLPVISYLAVQVVSNSGVVIGNLLFGHHEPAKFTNYHEQLVAAVANQASVALDNAKLYEEVKNLNAKKDEFIGLASHELKTPVTSISGFLQLIERNIAPEDRNKSFINKALQQVNRLSALISDLLDVSKIQTGKLPFSYTGFDMMRTLKDAIEIIRHTNPSHQIELQYHPEELNAYADQQRIEQVIINLVTNAIKYSPKAERVIITASASEDKVHVSVKDFGIGIEEQHQERIFSRFYRVENLASHMSGLGIGLYISREIIDRHNGKLWVESSLGAGSTFHFEIPLGR